MQDFSTKIAPETKKSIWFAWNAKKLLLIPSNCYHAIWKLKLREQVIRATMSGKTGTSFRFYEKLLSGCQVDLSFVVFRKIRKTSTAKAQSSFKLRTNVSKHTEPPWFQLSEVIRYQFFFIEKNHHFSTWTTNLRHTVYSLLDVKFKLNWECGNKLTLDILGM